MCVDGGNEAFFARRSKFCIIIMPYDLRKGPVILTSLSLPSLPAPVSFYDLNLKNTFPSCSRIVGESQRPFEMVLGTTFIFCLCSLTMFLAEPPG